MPTPSDPPAPRRHREVDLGDAPLPLTLELPASRGEGPDAAQMATAERPPRPRGQVRRWLVGLLLLVLAFAAMAALLVQWVLPAYVRSQCIETARAHGIALTIDDASLDGSGFRLLGVHATAAALPGARAQAPEVDVVTSGLHPERMTVHRADIALTGSWDAVATGLAAWRASPQGGQGGAWSPNALVIEESRLVWQAPFAETGSVEASNLHFDATASGTSATEHARSDDVVVVVPGGKVGPWRVDIDRGPGTSRVRVALDPGVPDACTVLVVGDDVRTASVDVAIPRSPIARLGLPPELLGLHGKSLQFEASAHYGTKGPQHAEVTTKGGLHGIEAGLPDAIDASWDATASGDPKAGLDVKKARLAVGPLVGALSGTVKVYEDGFRVDLAWTAAPVPCAAFESPLGGGSPLDMAYQLRKLAEGVGLTKITGDVSARGGLTFDSRDPGGARVEFTPEAKCSVSLFGR